jgi:hypothetical protein
MSPTYSDVLFWPEHRPFERPRKGFAHDPTELAEALLIAVAMRVHSLTDPPTPFGSPRNWLEHPTAYYTSEDMMILLNETGPELENVWTKGGDQLYTALFHHFSEQVGVVSFGSLRAELPVKAREHDWELIDDTFNRAAGLLWSRSRRHGNEAIRVYLSNAERAEKAASRAEIESKLGEAFKNRQAMAALMMENWLGLRLLSELAAHEKSTISELTSLVGADIDLTAAALAKLVGSGLAEVSGKFFVCNSKGSSVLRTLEQLIQSGDAGQNAGIPL